MFFGSNENHPEANYKATAAELKRITLQEAAVLENLATISQQKAKAQKNFDKAKQALEKNGLKSPVLPRLRRK